jgi:hypothetical protein
MEENGFFSRKEPRLSLEIPAEYQTEAGEKREFTPSILKSVAIGSFDLETGTKLPLDSLVTIRFRIPAEDDSAVVLCKVVRCVKGKTSDKWKSGLKIENMDTNTEEMLSGYIDSLGFYGWYYR